MIIAKIKPKSGFSHLLHIGFNALLPAILFVLVRMGFAPLAAALVLLSKWRMLAVRPRYWPANIRANAVDITVGLSIVIFMMNSNEAIGQLVWALVYSIWLIVIKPGSNIRKTSVQALVAQAFGLMAVFMAWGDAPLYQLVILVWVVCYTSARHYFSGFEETYTSLYAHSWGFIAGALTWLLGHWLLYYGVVAQPTLLLCVIGFGLASLYYLEQTERLSLTLRRQFIVMMTAIVTIVLLLSDWGDKAV